MKQPDRFHKGHRVIEEFNPKNTFVKVDSRDFRRPSTISLETVGDILQIKFEEDISRFNVTSVEFSDQDKNPKLPPNSCKISGRTHLAVDDNYLYVWNSKLIKWKRMLLSDWE